MVAIASEGPSSRIALLGPVPPFRSGIAQHTASLAKALDQRAEVLLLSFARQYPAWLYPGANDRDPSLSPPVSPTPEFLLDTLDPRSWFRALQRIDAFGADQVILPWWTVFFAPMTWVLARGCRKRGLPICLLCHNVLDHESAAWKVLLTKAVFREASAFAVHTHGEAARLEALCPGAHVVRHPHPLYDSFPNASEVLPRRAALELLFFGLVRPYKGLEILLAAMSLLDPRLSVHLTVVGEFWDGREEAEKQIAALGLAQRVDLVARYVSDDEAANHFERADAVVLPYHSVTGSGVIANAFHYRKPVIASRLEGFTELVQDGETGLLVPPGDPAALAEAIGRLSADRAEAMAPAIAHRTRDLTWDHLADCLLNAQGETASEGAHSKPKSHGALTALRQEP